MFNLYNIIALTGENLNCGDDYGYRDCDGENMIWMMVIVIDRSIIHLNLDLQRLRATPCFSSPT